MEESIKVVVFRMGEQRYGVDIRNVLGIEKVQTITDVPQTHDFIKGVISLRGDITPVIDLKERLQIGETEHAEQTRILIINMNTIQIGLLVDEATDVMEIDADHVEPTPEVLNAINASFLKGVAKVGYDLLVLLELEKVLTLDEINQVSEVIESE